MSINNVIFVEKSFQNVLAKININLIDQGAHKALTKFATGHDVARNIAIDRLVRGSVHFSDLGDFSPLENLIRESSGAGGAFDSLYKPLLSNPAFLEETLAWLQEENFPNMMGNQLPYHFSANGAFLVVGVEPGFLKAFPDLTAVRQFYKKALSEFTTHVSNPDLTGSNLFHKFVKLSITL